MAHSIVKTVLKNAAVPMVVDADALNIIAEQTEQLLRPHTELVLTPHLGGNVPVKTACRFLYQRKY